MVKEDKTKRGEKRKMKLIIASNNQHKIREIKKILLTASGGPFYGKTGGGG